MELRKIEAKMRHLGRDCGQTDVTSNNPYKAGLFRNDPCMTAIYLLLFFLFYSVYHEDTVADSGWSQTYISGNVYILD